MKTTVNFLEAVKALSEGKCEKIENAGGITYGLYNDIVSLTCDDLGIRLTAKRFLGEWKLIGVKQKIVIEDVKWHFSRVDNVLYPESSVCLIDDFSDKPKMKMTLEWTT